MGVSLRAGQCGGNPAEPVERGAVRAIETTGRCEWRAL